MAEHTPTTDEVREVFVDGAEGDFIGEDFDRWLTAHDAELRAEVERLREGAGRALVDRDAYRAELDEARQQVADLRAGVEALLPGETVNVYAGGGNLVSQRRVVDPDHLRALLAGSGERSGEVYGPRPTGCCGKCPPIEGGGYDCTCEGNPRCVRERVRDVFVNAERRESFGGTDIDALTDAVLAVVGRGVTDCNCGFGGQHDPANPRCRANRATVRPSGQEGL